MRFFGQSYQRSIVEGGLRIIGGLRLEEWDYLHFLEPTKVHSTSYFAEDLSWFAGLSFAVINYQDMEFLFYEWAIRV